MAVLGKSGTSLNVQCGQVAARQMVAQNQAGTSHGGVIINMSSVNAVMAIPTIASYNASKGGLNNLTRSTPSLISHANLSRAALQYFAIYHSGRERGSTAQLDLMGWGEISQDVVTA